MYTNIVIVVHQCLCKCTSMLVRVSFLVYKTESECSIDNYYYYTSKLINSVYAKLCPT